MNVLYWLCFPFILVIWIGITLYLQLPHMKRKLRLEMDMYKRQSYLENQQKLRSTLLTKDGKRISL